MCAPSLPQKKNRCNRDNTRNSVQPPSKKKNDVTGIIQEIQFKSNIILVFMASLQFKPKKKALI